MKRLLFGLLVICVFNISNTNAVCYRNSVNRIENSNPMIVSLLQEFKSVKTKCNNVSRNNNMYIINKTPNIKEININLKTGEFYSINNNINDYLTDSDKYSTNNTSYSTECDTYYYHSNQNKIQNNNISNKVFNKYTNSIDIIDEFPEVNINESNNKNLNSSNKYLKNNKSNFNNVGNIFLLQKDEYDTMFFDNNISNTKLDINNKQVSYEIKYNTHSYNTNPNKKIEEKIIYFNNKKSNNINNTNKYIQVINQESHKTTSHIYHRKIVKYSNIDNQYTKINNKSQNKSKIIKLKQNSSTNYINSKQNNNIIEKKISLKKIKNKKYNLVEQETNIEKK